MEDIISKVYKGGRCWNGNHADAGTVVHLIKGECPGSYWGGKALCGAETGKRSYGWAATTKQPTCTKCLKKISPDLLNQ